MKATHSVEEHVRDVIVPQLRQLASNNPAAHAAARSSRRGAQLLIRRPDTIVTCLRWHLDQR
jgi:porphobilinogen deaminase